MGDSISDNFSQLPMDVAIILLGLRFSGWLILPLVIGVFLEQTREEFARRERHLFETEKRLLDSEAFIKVEAAKRLVEKGMEEDRANRFLADLKQELDKRFKSSV